MHKNLSVETVYVHEHGSILMWPKSDEYRGLNSVVSFASYQFAPIRIQIKLAPISMYLIETSFLCYWNLQENTKIRGKINNLKKKRIGKKSVKNLRASSQGIYCVEVFLAQKEFHLSGGTVYLHEHGSILRWLKSDEYMVLKSMVSLASYQVAPIKIQIKLAPIRTYLKVNSVPCYGNLQKNTKIGGKINNLKEKRRGKKCVNNEAVFSQSIHCFVILLAQNEVHLSVGTVYLHEHRSILRWLESDDDMVLKCVVSFVSYYQFALTKIQIIMAQITLYLKATLFLCYWNS